MLFKFLSISYISFTSLLICFNFNFSAPFLFFIDNFSKRENVALPSSDDLFFEVSLKKFQLAKIF